MTHLATLSKPVLLSVLVVAGRHQQDNIYTLQCHTRQSLCHSKKTVHFSFVRPARLKQNSALREQRNA